MMHQLTSLRKNAGQLILSVGNGGYQASRKHGGLFQ
jgi:hypothetical protein